MSIENTPALQKRDATVNTEVLERLRDESTNDFAMTPEQEMAMRNHFASVTKKITVKPLSQDALLQIDEALIVLGSLRTEILIRKNGALEKRTSIKEMIEVLKDSGKVNIDEERVAREDEGVGEFIKLLDEMILEVEKDDALYRYLIKPEDSELVVLTQDPDDYEAFVKNRVGGVKRHVKVALRDLAVSYSRYCFGFDRQITQLQHVVRMLKTA